LGSFACPHVLVARTGRTCCEANELKELLRKCLLLHPATPYYPSPEKIPY